MMAMTTRSSTRVKATCRRFLTPLNRTIPNPECPKLESITSPEPTPTRPLRSQLANGPRFLDYLAMNFQNGTARRCRLYDVCQIRNLVLEENDAVVSERMPWSLSPVFRSVFSWRPVLGDGAKPGAPTRSKGMASITKQIFYDFIIGFARDTKPRYNVVSNRLIRSRLLFAGRVVELADTQDLGL